MAVLCTSRRPHRTQLLVSPSPANLATLAILWQVGTEAAPSDLRCYPAELIKYQYVGQVGAMIDVRDTKMGP